jgi:hypothetical protein
MSTAESSRISTAKVVTENGTSYMKQLCRHWAHKFPVEFNDERGTIDLPTARCTLEPGTAELLVTVIMTAEADQDRMEQVVAEHLQRFGFRETLVFDWTRT